MMPGAPEQAASSRWPAWVRYLLYFLIVAGLVRSLSSSSGGPKSGDPAAAFELPSASGSGRIKLSDYRGRPVLIEVFASWCSSCQAAAPMMAKLASDYRSRVDFVGVSVDETAEQALATAKHWDIEFPVALDDGAFSRSYDINTVPSFVLIDKNGVVVQTIRGIPKRGTLDASLADLTQADRAAVIIGSPKG